MGITRIANITGLDTVGIPVVTVCRPNARSNAVCQGKGLSLDAAKASGVMESIETFCAEHILKPLMLAGAAEMKRRHTLIDLEDIPRLKGSSLSADTRLLWIEGRELFGDYSIWVPFETVHSDFTVPRPVGSGYFPVSTNGLASGNCTSEAVCHGICEIIERDAATLFSLAPRLVEERRIQLDSIDDPECRRVIDKLVDANLAVAVWDITSDIGIAAFRCNIMEQGHGPASLPWPAEGHGCHPNRVIALLRALTEAAQARLTVIAGSRDDIGPDLYCRADDLTVREQLHQNVLSWTEVRDFGAVPSRCFDDVNQDIEHLLMRLQGIDVRQVIVVEISPFPPDLCSVVRIIIPGLEGLQHEAYLPGPRARSLGKH
jgi:YcaO-like protein with predicted kinase domain